MISRNLNGKSDLSLTPVLTQWAVAILSGHIWRWVTVPPNFVWWHGHSAWSEHTIIAMCYGSITLTHACFKSMREDNKHLTKMLGRLSCDKIQRYSNSSPYRTLVQDSKMAATSDSFLKFPWLICTSWLQICIIQYDFVIMVEWSKCCRKSFCTTGMIPPHLEINLG